MALDLALLAVAFVVILLGAELFTNGIEWFGERFGFGDGVVGRVLAAVGTALPETMIPIIAILFVDTADSHAIGIGAILGAPFMLSTAAMFVTGVAVLTYARSGRRKAHLVIDQVQVGRDLRFFLGAYVAAILLGLPFWTTPTWVHRSAGAGLLLAYAYYVYRTLRQPRGDGHGEELRRLHFHRSADSPHTALIVVQLVASLAAIVIGAQLFVDRIEHVATALAIPALVLSLVIAPLATELPEKFNSVIWVRQRKDNLAIGNISGAMVFQSCIPVTIGLWFTPWVLDQFALASAIVAVIAGLLVQVYLRTGHVITGRELTSLGALYAALILYIVLAPHELVALVR